MNLNENIIIELVGINETDKETLIDYFENKKIKDLFTEYSLLDISEVAKMQIKNILIVLENSGKSKTVLYKNGNN